MQSGPPQLLRSSLHMAIADGAKWSDIVRQNPNMTDAISERVRRYLNIPYPLWSTP